MACRRIVRRLAQRGLLPPHRNVLEQTRGSSTPNGRRLTRKAAPGADPYRGFKQNATPLENDVTRNIECVRVSPRTWPDSWCNLMHRTDERAFPGHVADAVGRRDIEGHELRDEELVRPARSSGRFTARRGQGAPPRVGCIAGAGVRPR